MKKMLNTEFNFEIGQLFKVLIGIDETYDFKWFQKDDIVRLIGIYPNMILLEKVKPGKDGWHMRQGYNKNAWSLELEPYYGR